MILLRFEHNIYNSTYHLFDSFKDMDEWMRECYDEVRYSEDKMLVMYSFEDVRKHADIIKPVIHEKVPV